ncbi:MAG: NAD(P)-dependent oxidoreductase [Ignisphaera sp.]
MCSKLYSLAMVNYDFLKDYIYISDLIGYLKRYCDRIDFITVPKEISEEELAKVLQGYHFLIVSTYPRYGRKFFELNKDVLLVFRFGLGYDNVDIKAAEELGVAVARIPPYVEREAVAEHTVALILASLRRITKADKLVKIGRIRVAVYDTKFINELAGPKDLSEAVVGIMGFGNIGSRVAEILIKGFNSKVLAYDPYIPKEKMLQMGSEPVNSLTELFERSDIVSIHAPLTKETYHAVNKEILSKAKRGLIIINTARGEIIDTEALIWALKEGIVDFVALDVVEGEPIPPDHPLLKFDNVIVTPHMAVFTHTTLRKMFKAAVNAIVNYIEGKSIEEQLATPKTPRLRP